MRTEVEIINIGDELLIGQVVNTNASWMGSLLSQNGFYVKTIKAIADSAEAIESALDYATKNAQVILLSGGLGPTKDDITKKVLAKYFESDMYFNEQSYENIARLFYSRGFPVSDDNRLQAFLPVKAQAIPNRNGTAYGMWFEKDNTVIVSMPGVPFEMKTMMEKEVLPRLKARFSVEVYYQKVIMTTGLGESMLAKEIEAEENALPEYIKLAYLPKPGFVRLRLSARGTDDAQLKSDLEYHTSQIVSRLGKKVVYGSDEDSLEQVLGNLLLKHQLTVSTAESCTGGTIAQTLTSKAGSSAYFLGGIVSYSNEAKMHLLGVDKVLIDNFGAVSKEVVEQMARGGQKAFKSDYCIATSGIAGPGGGTDEKPVGTTWIALAGPKGVISAKYSLGEDRGRNIFRASTIALNLLRMAIMDGLD